MTLGRLGARLSIGEPADASPTVGSTGHPPNSSIASVPILYSIWRDRRPGTPSDTEPITCPPRSTPVPDFSLRSAVHALGGAYSPGCCSTGTGYEDRSDLTAPIDTPADRLAARLDHVTRPRSDKYRYGGPCLPPTGTCHDSGSSIRLSPPRSRREPVHSRISTRSLDSDRKPPAIPAHYSRIVAWEESRRCMSLLLVRHPTPPFCRVHTTAPTHPPSSGPIVRGSLLLSPLAPPGLCIYWSPGHLCTFSSACLLPRA